MPGGGRRTSGHHHATAADYAYQPPPAAADSADSPPFYHRRQPPPLSHATDVVVAGRGRFGSATLPRRDFLFATGRETGTGNGRSTVGSPPTVGRGGGGGWSPLTTAVSDVDIAGGSSSSHLLPLGDATAGGKRPTDARSNHAGGLISKSLLVLPDTSV